MRPREIRCSEHVCRVAVPWECLVLLPNAKAFEPVWKLPEIFVVSRRKGECVIEVPAGTVLRVGKAPKASYFLVRGGLVKLKGARAKILGLGRWGWHYRDPRTGEHVLTVIYQDGAFIRA